MAHVKAEREDPALFTLSPAHNASRQSGHAGQNSRQAGSGVPAASGLNPGA